MNNDAATTTNQIPSQSENNEGEILRQTIISTCKSAVFHLELIQDYIMDHDIRDELVSDFSNILIDIDTGLAVDVMTKSPDAQRTYFQNWLFERNTESLWYKFTDQINQWERCEGGNILQDTQFCQKALNQVLPYCNAVRTLADKVL